MDAPVSQLSSPLLNSEGRTVELFGVVRLKKEKGLGGFWTCQTVLLGVVGMKEKEGWRENLLRKGPGRARHRHRCKESWEERGKVNAADHVLSMWEQEISLSRAFGHHSQGMIVTMADTDLSVAVCCYESSVIFILLFVKLYIFVSLQLFCVGLPALCLREPVWVSLCVVDQSDS